MLNYEEIAIKLNNTTKNILENYKLYIPNSEEDKKQYMRKAFIIHMYTRLCRSRSSRCIKELYEYTYQNDNQHLVEQIEKKRTIGQDIDEQIAIDMIYALGNEIITNVSLAEKYISIFKGEHSKDVEFIKSKALTHYIVDIIENYGYN